ncbi:hypothetical protein WJX84_012133 [Apatococcus fuscideae]|uniref:Rhodanese domain-containing protein n=1 Tax=Apatococcus fuscideae TaxID=2026836 RepID=A0AAW1TGR4_9CHLO
MPSVANVGGSITSAVALTLLAWAVRFIRSAHNKRVGAARRPPEVAQTNTTHSRFYTCLSPASIQLLVETNPFPHCIFDVCPDRPAAPEKLPPCLSAAVRLPAKQVQAVLGGGMTAWMSHSSASQHPMPSPHHFIVFISGNEAEMEEAANAAAACAFEHVAVLQGSLSHFDEAVNAQGHLRYIHRDALAILLQRQNTSGSTFRLLDVRRSDERMLFGSIEGSCHLPAHQLPAALQWPPSSFEAAYHFPKPTLQDLIILQSRTHKRAAWAAQAAIDAGYKHCIVYRQGTYGWRLHPSVKAYKSYELGHAPPEPDVQDPDSINHSTAQAELLQLYSHPQPHGEPSSDVADDLRA